MSTNSFVATASQTELSGVAEGAIIRYKIAKLGTAKQQVAAAGAGDACFGISQDGVATTVEVGIVVAGTSFVIAGAATTKGAWLKSDENAEAIDATAGDEVVGKCLSAAGAQGDRIPILVQPHVLSMAGE